jgi:hypothetical protein
MIGAIFVPEMLVSSDRFKVNDLPKTHVMRRTNQNRVCLIFECYFHIIYILSFLLIVEHTSEIPTTRHNIKNPLKSRF